MLATLEALALDKSKSVSLMCPNSSMSIFSGFKSLMHKKKSLDGNKVMLLEKESIGEAHIFSKSNCIRIYMLKNNAREKSNSINKHTAIDETKEVQVLQSG